MDKPETAYGKGNKVHFMFHHILKNIPESFIFLIENSNSSSLSNTDWIAFIAGLKFLIYILTNFASKDRGYLPLIVYHRVLFTLLSQSTVKIINKWTLSSIN